VLIVNLDHRRTGRLGVRNILRQSNDAEVAIDPSLFIDDAERALFDSVTECANTVHLETSIGRYGHSLSALATLQRPVDRFFADVMVNADDIPTRLNRLALLRVLDSLCRSVADISLLPG
jgi:glycyl-tRNA synthetase beta chain